MLEHANIIMAVKALLAIGRPIRVLIIEDHPDLSRMMTLLLRHCGFDVRALQDGLAALAVARSFRPHCILLDIGLPGKDGFQVAAEIRAEASLASTKIIAVSAYGPEMHPDRSLISGIDHHLTKPVGLGKLLDLLVPNILP